MELTLEKWVNEIVKNESWYYSCMIEAKRSLWGR